MVYSCGLILALIPWVGISPELSPELWLGAGGGGYRMAFPTEHAVGSEQTRLAEVIQTQDSVIYRTDNKDAEYYKRQREERDKEKKSWEMLNNIIIDGRQPPRRFSDPRPNELPR